MKRVYGKSLKSFSPRMIMGVVTLLLIILPYSARGEMLGVFGDWNAFKTVEGSDHVCYIGAEPEKAEGDYKKRGDTYVLVTQRPGIGELDVVSIRGGYNYRKGSEVMVKIGETSISMFTIDGRAWAKDTKTDQTLVAAMKRGMKMIIKGISWRGTLTRDTYSLEGFTAAYSTSLAACNLK